MLKSDTGCVQIFNTVNLLTTGDEFLFSASIISISVFEITPVYKSGFIQICTVLIN